MSCLDGNNIKVGGRIACKIDGDIIVITHEGIRLGYRVKLIVGRTRVVNYSPSSVTSCSILIRTRIYILDLGT